MDSKGFTTSCPRRLPGLLLLLLLLCNVGHATTSRDRFDRAFEHFLSSKGYRGGAVAAMKDGRLLVAKGYGVDRAGREVTAHTAFPVSSVAKSLTAAVVMKLVQDGELRLDDQVFGSNGILYDITPFGKGQPDARIYDITVDQLLRHTAGWDSTKGPLYDPVYNQVYHKRGLQQEVPNIAKEMNTATPLDPGELIRYVMAQPLAFNPGTRVAYSNFGYLVLGRVIEAITDWDYVKFVKKTIINPCGMWKTSIYPSYSQSTDDLEAYELSVLDGLDLESVDSSLGWYSNAYDMMRFTRCLFDTDTILDDRHLELLLARPRAAPVQHEPVWHCAGFRTSTKNIVWQDADAHADDLILYHNLNPRGAALDTLLRRGSARATDLPDSWAVLLFDRVIGHVRHYTRELMARLQPGEMPPPADENLFLADLSQLHGHPMWEMPRSLLVPEFTVRYRVDEHHVTPYVNALRAEGFTVHSLSSLTHRGRTTFLVVGRRVTTTDRVDSDFLFEHGMDYRKLLKKKLELEAAGYNMTLLHSYKSKSHLQHYCFAAVFRYEAFTPNMQMKYGTNHLPEPYEKLVQMYHEKEFYPLSQTVIYLGKEARFSFIFVNRPGSPRVDFRHHSDLSPKKLSKLAAEYLLKNRPLAYLNSYDIKGKFRFSAVFSNGTYAPGVLEIEQPENRATEITISNLNDRLVPKQMVPYVGGDGEFKVATFYQEV